MSNFNKICLILITYVQLPNLSLELDISSFLQWIYRNHFGYINIFAFASTFDSRQLLPE